MENDWRINSWPLILKPVSEQNSFSTQQSDDVSPPMIKPLSQNCGQQEQNGDQTCVPDISVEQTRQSRNIKVMYFQEQTNNVFQTDEEEAELSTNGLNTLKNQTLILFFMQFCEKAIISNYKQTKSTEQLFLLLNRNQNQSIKTQIFEEFQKIRKVQETQIFISQKHDNLDLIHINNPQPDASAINNAAFIKMLKAKYYSKDQAFLWKLYSDIDFAALQRDFNRQNILTYLLDKKTLLFINREQFQGKIVYKNYDNEAKELVVARDPTIYESITSVKTIYLDPFILQKAQSANNLNIINLVRILQRYPKTQFHESYVFQNTIKVHLGLNFSEVEDLASFLKEIYQNKFQLTVEGVIKQIDDYSNCAAYENQNSLACLRDSMPLQFSSPRVANNCQAGVIDIQKDSLLLKSKDEGVLQRIKSANIYLRQFLIWDLLALWNLGLKQTVLKIINHWDIYACLIQQETVLFARMVEFKLERLKLRKIQIYKDIFKDISDTIQRLVYVLRIEKLSILLDKLQNKYVEKGKKFNSTFQQQQSCNQKLKFETQKQLTLNALQREYQMQKQSNIQQVIHNYVFHKTSPNKDLPFILKLESGKQTMSQFIAERLNHRNQISKLRNIIALINYHLGQTNDLNSSRDIVKIYGQKLSTQIQQSYFISIQEERIVETRCIGCATFFKVKSNIFDEAINTVPFKVFPSVQKMKEYESQIKAQICSMLNSGGGCILFDCYHHYQKVIVKGISLNEKSKQQYQQRFASYLDTFQPKTNIKRCIDIKFVPVVADQFKIENNQIVYENYTGGESLLKQNQSYRLRPYLQNVYVMRVKICPFQPEKVYFWNQNNDKEQKEINKSYLCTHLVDGVSTSIKMSKIAHLIKQKMKKYYLPQRFKGDERICLEVPFSCFDHQCRDPQAGVGACLQMSYDKKVLDTRQSGVLSQNLSNNKFQNASLLIIKRQHLNDLKRKLLSEGIQCQIEQKFQNYKFQSAKNSAVLYHNKRFEDILKKVLQNPKFNFNGRQLIMINITNYVKLSRRNESTLYPVQDFLNLKDWLKKEFPEQQVKLFEFKSKEKQPKTVEYYLQTQSSQSTLFIYYVLNKFGEKATFKNPLHLDKLSQEQKKQRFRQIYNFTQSAHYQLRITSEADILQSQYRNSQTSFQPCK